MTVAPITPIAPLARDVRAAASTLGPREARYLVDLYYQSQDFRKATDNQVRSMLADEVDETQIEEPHETIAFFASQFGGLEEQIRRTLDRYSSEQPLGAWAKQTVGVGPVIAAGLLAHIDIERAPTAGAIWRFAGLDPTVKWEKGQKRPWNGDLKVLCWKLGDSFVKVSGNEKSLYGRLYRERKAYELERDSSGGNAETAARTLEEKTIREPGTRKIYESGQLPAGRLDLRARRWAVKLFLSHYHHAAYRLHFGEEPPKPFAIEHGGHVHYIAPEVELP